jgi:hypothetical protein
MMGELMGESAEQIFLHGFPGKFAPVNSLHHFLPKETTPGIYLIPLDKIISTCFPPGITVHGFPEYFRPQISVHVFPSSTFPSATCYLFFMDIFSSSCFAGLHSLE